MTSGLSHLNYNHGFGVWQLLGMLMCTFQKSKSIGHQRVHAAVSQNEWSEWWRGAMKQKKEYCMLVNLQAFMIHNRWPSEKHHPPSVSHSGMILCERAHFSLHLSPHNLPPFLPLFSFQISIQFAHQRKLTSRKKAAMWTSARNFSLSFSLHFSLLYLPPTAARCP